MSALFLLLCLALFGSVILIPMRKFSNGVQNIEYDRTGIVWKYRIKIFIQ